MKYGLMIYNPRGEVIFDTSDRIVRVVDFHNIPDGEGGGSSYVGKFDHPELLQYGEVVVWFTSGYFSGYSVGLDVNGSVISLKLIADLSTWPYSAVRKNFKLFYGVR